MVNYAHFSCAARGAHLDKELNIRGVVLSPLFWHIVFVVNGLNWTDRFTGPTIHTFVGVNVEHSVAFINTVDWAFINARSIFHIHTGQCDYIRHEEGVLSPSGLVLS